VVNLCTCFTAIVSSTRPGACCFIQLERKPQVLMLYFQVLYFDYSDRDPTGIVGMMLKAQPISSLREELHPLAYNQYSVCQGLCYSYRVSENLVMP